MKCFIESQFAYCLLVRVCQDNPSDNRINHLCECTLRTIYNDNILTFEKFIRKDNPITINLRNLRILERELYKTRENIAALIMYETFEQRNIQYIVHSQISRWLTTANCGLRGLKYPGPIIWDIVYLEMKSAKTLKQCTMKIKS